ncbi:MAG: T9SS type A sorting domain-containing protein [Flavobacteriales bacterium]|nr:T9SS type A sorting domain-containing protein [Flavobacteriales bacterium]
MIRSITAFITFVATVLVGQAQTVALFTIAQPPQFQVDAGGTQYYYGSPLTLGGQPTASGGSAAYTFVWEPSEGLDDPTAANPVLLELAAATLFTVTVTDVAINCVRVSEVEVLLSTGLGEQEARTSSVYPNPASTSLRVEAQEVIHSITLRSLAGRSVMLVAHPSASSTRLDIGHVPDGLYLLTITLASGRTVNHKLCKAT